MTEKKILLAEDDPDDRDLFCKFAQERKDLNVLPPVENGVELFAYLDAIADHELPDLIILDHNMPKKTGLESLQLLKMMPRYAAIPVMVYSTYTDKTLIQTFRKEGAVAVSLKPLTGEGYRAMVEYFVRSIQ